MAELLKTAVVEDAIAEQTSPFVTVMQACRRSVKAAAAFSLVLNLLQLTVPLYMMTLLDRVIGSGNTASLYLLTLIAVVALGVSAALDVLRSHILNRAASWLESRLGVELFPHVAMALHNGMPVKAQGLEDLWRLRSFMSSPGLLALFDIPWMVFYFIVLFLIAVPLGLLALIGAVVLLGIAIYNENSVRAVLSNAQNIAETSRDFVRSVQRSSDEIQSMGMMPAVMNRWLTHNIKALRDQYTSSTRAATNLALFKTFRMILQLAVLFTGAILVLGGNLSPGAIVGASLIMSRALAPVEQAITAWKQAISALGSYSRLRDSLPAESERKVSARRPDGPVDITLQDMSFAFPGAEQPFLKGISLEAVRGEILTVIGPSASGKSTLGRVISGAYNPTEGFVMLGNFEVSHFSRDELGGFVGYVPQKLEFLPGSIYENIARFQEMPIEQVIEAASRIGAHDFIMELPKGYDTRIGGDQGHPLSGGQLQRLAIARALCGRPGLLVLDEPNLNLDNESEALLIRALDEEKARGVTVIVISHQKSMIERADKLALIVRGRLSQFGTKAQVLRRLSGPAKPGVAPRQVGPAPRQSGISGVRPIGANRLPERSGSNGGDTAASLTPEGFARRPAQPPLPPQGGQDD
ncbi:type I secretion system permease/ATPase [Gimibacter soli]|uniref:Type I secretion system permease/ATPase n=1 Tax=Gimibacter soli TaxID=3024400 RepID=A0AAE9XN95_9PROT|nr:type I secretion system permease/ATPase [Gimibacter soli]WCL53167.1 type I secretion system permease/ATPase [Gimibacter soli]